MGGVRDATGGEGADRALAEGLQHRPPAQLTGISAPTQPPAPVTKPRPNGRIAQQPTVIDAPVTPPPSRLNGNGSPNGQRNGTAESATNKQIQFILTVGKRLKLSTPQIGEEIKKIVGRECGVYDLTKKEAGVLLDFWTTQLQACRN